MVTNDETTNGPESGETKVMESAEQKAAVHAVRQAYFNGKLSFESMEAKLKALNSPVPKSMKAIPRKRKGTGMA